METRNNKQKEVGFAIHGLRAYIKALELAKGVRVSTAEFRYEISADRVTARIVVSADTSEIEGTKKPLTEWATIGKQARLGLIGLRAEKESLRAAGTNVQYTLNVLTGEAQLSSNGAVVEGHPRTIAEWAAKGREVEKKAFESLNGALEFGCDDAAADVRKDMVRLGIIRERRNADEQPAA